MGRIPDAVAPAENRLGAALMLCLALVAVIVAPMWYRSTGEAMQAGLLVVLAVLGAWQASVYWRGHH